MSSRGKKVVSKKAEKILGATDASGQLMYLMKWEEINDLDLISAKEANTMCPQIVINFYQEKLISNKEAGLSKVNRKTKKNIKLEKSKRTSTVHNIAEKIMGVTDTRGEFMYLMKWEGIDDLELISTKEANCMYPQILIKFYEERLTWFK